MTWIEFTVAIVAGLFGFTAAAWLTRTFDLRRPNFRKHRVPSIGGLALLFAAEFFYTYEWFSQGIRVGSIAAYLLVVLGFGVLGLHDDLSGDRSIGGFRGHFGALLRGKFTTGAAKAIGGAAVSIVAAYLIGYPVVSRMLLAFFLIALSSNASNLMDVRPGRCLFAFFCATGIIAISLALHQELGVGFLLYILAAFAFILYPLDAAGQLMLGDTGSNSLGAIMGVAAALCLTPIWQAVLVAGLIGFHIWCEGHSLTAFIEKHPLLRRIDRKIGVR